MSADSLAFGAQLLKTALAFLSIRSQGDRRLNSDLATQLIATLRRPMRAQRARLRISLDLVNPAANTWEIAASTDVTAPTRTPFLLSQGLTGWMVRTKHAHYLLATVGDELPTDLTPTPSFESIQSAFVQLIRGGDHIQACLCAVSDIPHAIDTDLADALNRLASHVQVFVSAARTQVAAAPPIEVLTGRPHLGESVVPDWISRILGKTTYRFANYWEWRTADEQLVPIQTTATLSGKGTSWLRPMRLGEGFVGRAAELRRIVEERRIVNGIGETSRIATPNPEILPGVPLKSILAAPVAGKHRLYGVIAILAETELHFSEEDRHVIEFLAGTIATEMEAQDGRRLHELEGRVLDGLVRGFRMEGLPSDSWRAVGKSLAELVSFGACRSIYMFVQRRSDPELYTCKVAVPALAQQVWLRLEEQEAFRQAIRHDGTRIRDGRVLNRGPLKKLAKDEGASVIVATYLKPGGSSTLPLLVALAPLVSRAQFTAQEVAPVFETVLGTVFTTTMAVLAGSDLKRLSLEHARLVASETHKIRQPLAAVRSKVESLHVISGEDERRKREILRIVDRSLLDTENMLYASTYLRGERGDDDTHAGTRVGAPSPEDAALVDLAALVRRLVIEATELYEEHTITVEDRLGEQATRFVWGTERWLAVALRNLIDNGVKFGLRQPVSVIVSQEDATRDIRDERERGYVRVTVMDRGIGIVKSELERVFQRGFRSAHSRRHVVTGANMGLWITREIVESMGGHVWAQPDVTHGAVFHVVLPVRGE